MNKNCHFYYLFVCVFCYENIRKKSAEEEEKRRSERRRGEEREEEGVIYQKYIKYTTASE